MRNQEWLTCDSCSALIQRVGNWNSQNAGSGESGAIEACVTPHRELVQMAAKDAGSTGCSYLYRCERCGRWWVISFQNDPILDEISIMAGTPAMAKEWSYNDEP